MKIQCINTDNNEKRLDTPIKKCLRIKACRIKKTDRLNSSLPYKQDKQKIILLRRKLTDTTNDSYLEPPFCLRIKT